MTIASLTALLLKHELLFRVLRIAGAGVLGAAILAWVVDHSGSQTCEAVIHIVVENVEISVGPNTFRVRARMYQPIVCILPVGRHKLVVAREGQTLMEENFKMRSGQSIILTAYDPKAVKHYSPPTPNSGWKFKPPWQP